MVLDDGVGSMASGVCRQQRCLSLRAEVERLVLQPQYVSKTNPDDDFKTCLPYSFVVEVGRKERVGSGRGGARTHADLGKTPTISNQFIRSECLFATLPTVTCFKSQDLHTSYLLRRYTTLP